MANWYLVEILGNGYFGLLVLATPKHTTEESPDYFAIKIAFINSSSSLLNEELVLKHFIGCTEIVQCLGSEITTINSRSIYNLKLEYAAGGTLEDLIRLKMKLPDCEVREYLRMILRGLSQIHGKGFLHADLQPHNIFAFPQSDGKIKLKIANFGLSKRRASKNEVSCLNCSNRFKGILIYMSPESVLFPGYNYACLDIWSLGCIMVKMISGECVWKDCSNHTQLNNKLVDKEVPKIPDKLLSTEGRSFIRRCLDPDPIRRWTADMLLKHPYLREEKQ